MLSIEFAFVWIVSRFPQYAFAYLLLLQFLVFRYIPYVFVLAFEDLAEKVSRHEVYISNVPLVECTMALLQTVFKFFESLAATLQNLVSNETYRDDSNALVIAFLRYCFSGATGPLTLDSAELEFTRIFLPFGMRVKADIIRQYGAMEFFRSAPFHRGLAIVSRVNYLDNLFQSFVLNRGVKQLVILGAGYDTRGFRFGKLCKEKGATVVEIDQPFIQERKRDLLKKAFGVDSQSSVQYVPCVFKDDSSLSHALEQLDPNLSTLFIMEGVSPYLSRKAFDATFRTLGEFRRLSKDRETSHWIVFDIYIREKLEQLKNESPFDLSRIAVRSAIGHPDVCVSGAEDCMKTELSNMGLSVEGHTAYADLLRADMNKHTGSDLSEDYLGMRFVVAKIQI